jgi:hypothetical protein
VTSGREIQEQAGGFAFLDSERAGGALGVASDLDGLAELAFDLLIDLERIDRDQMWLLRIDRAARDVGRDDRPVGVVDRVSWVTEVAGAGSSRTKWEEGQRDDHPH